MLDPESRGDIVCVMMNLGGYLTLAMNNTAYYNMSRSTNLHYPVRCALCVGTLLPPYDTDDLIVGTTMTMKVSIAVLAFAWILTGCEQAFRDDVVSEGDTSAQKLEDFLGVIKSRLVFVEGGEFLMGDYGEKYGPDRLRYDRKRSMNHTFISVGWCRILCLSSSHPVVVSPGLHVTAPETAKAADWPSVTDLMWYAHRCRPEHFRGSELNFCATEILIPLAVN